MDFTELLTADATHHYLHDVIMSWCPEWPLMSCKLAPIGFPAFSVSLRLESRVIDQSRKYQMANNKSRLIELAADLDPPLSPHIVQDDKVSLLGMCGVCSVTCGTWRHQTQTGI